MEWGSLLCIASNPWVIGIGGGILSGLIVAVISRFVLSRRDRKEYYQRIAMANNELLYALRPGISEGIIPSTEIIKSLISATARKYGVDKSSMHNLDDISSELIKEVMDSSFLSAKAKTDFCETLGAIREPVLVGSSPTGDSELQVSARYRRQMVVTMSVFVGLLTGLAGFFSEKEISGSLDIDRFVFLALPAMVAVVVSIVAVLVRDIQRVGNGYIKRGFFRAELRKEMDKAEDKIEK